MSGWVIIGAWICGTIAVLYIARKAGLCGEDFMLTEFAAVMWPISLPLLGITICVFWATNKIKGE